MTYRILGLLHFTKPIIITAAGNRCKADIKEAVMGSGLTFPSLPLFTASSTSTLQQLWTSHHSCQVIHFFIASSPVLPSPLLPTSSFTLALLYSANANIHLTYICCAPRCLEKQQVCVEIRSTTPKMFYLVFIPLPLFLINSGWQWRDSAAPKWGRDHNNRSYPNLLVVLKRAFLIQKPKKRNGIVNWEFTSLVYVPSSPCCSVGLWARQQFSGLPCKWSHGILAQLRGTQELPLKSCCAYCFGMVLSPHFKRGNHEGWVS